MKIYRVVKGELEEIDKFVFTSGDSYVVDDGDTIWLWHGKNASVDEKATAATSAERIDEDTRGGKAKVIALDQGEFSANMRRFKALAGDEGLLVLDKNIAESFLKKVEKPIEEPLLFKVSSEEVGGDINAIEYVQVPLDKSNLDPDDCMLLFVPMEETTYVWVGSKANIKEKVTAGKVARQFDKNRAGVQKEIFIDEGDEPDDFWKQFP